MCAMGSCIKVVKQKNVVSSRHPKAKPQIFCHETADFLSWVFAKFYNF
jgi:hypothetical protein